MIKGLYTSGGGMKPRMLRLDVVANNLANAGTTGFKRDNMFVEIMQNSASEQAKSDIDIRNLQVREFTDFSSGDLQQTSNRLDFAIQGKGFFTVEAPEGIKYTRNGNFSLSIDGTVVTSDGYPVLGTAGHIRVPDLAKLKNMDIAVDEKGEMTVGPTNIGKFKISDFKDFQNLSKDQGSFFVAKENEKPLDVDEENSIVRQGFLEGSNVNAIDEMIQMIDLQRNFETESKLIQSFDTTLGRASEVGRL